MIAFNLAINHVELAASKNRDQGDQGHFRSVGYPAEHGLTEKDPTHGHTEKSAHQRADIIQYFYGVVMAKGS
mgnify:CR=1 FL=1